MEEIKHALLELGLNDKEIEVYIAMLELGPAAAQDIATQSKINRTTCYVMIDGLKRRGLASEVEQGKKTLYSAQHPDQLLRLLVDESARIRAKQEKVEAALPQLMALFNVLHEKPKVRYFDGGEELFAIRKEVRERRQPVWEVYAVDEALKKVAQLDEKTRIENTETFRDSRILMAIKPGCLPPYFDRSGIEARVLDYGKFPFAGNITMCQDTLYIVTNKSQGLGIIIDSSEIASMFRSLYEAAWQLAKPWNPPAEWRRPY